jgi:MFS family permease
MVGLWRDERGARAFFAAVALGATGTAAAYVALMLVAYERLGSAWAASAVLLAELLPGMLFGPLVGAWIDRRDRRRCLVAAQVVHAAALAAMIVVPGAPALLALAVLTGFAGDVARPATFALLPTMVREERRMAAVALWGAVRDSGMLIGPALAAGVLLLGGPELLLGAVAVALVAAAATFARVRFVSEPERDTGDASLVDGVREGLRYVGRDRVLRLLASATGVIVLASGMMNVAEVLLAQEDLEAGGAGFALLVTVFGVGSVLGSLASARSTTLARLKRGYVAGHGVLGLGLLGTALAPTVAWAAAGFFVTGLGTSAAMTHDRGLLQQLVPGHMLSRVHGLVGSIEAWGLAGAALLGGTLATLLGARGVFVVSGCALVLIAALSALVLLPRTNDVKGAADMPRARA